MKTVSLPLFGMPKTGDYEYVISTKLVQKEMTDYFDFEFSKK